MYFLIYNFIRIIKETDHIMIYSLIFIAGNNHFKDI